MPELSKSYKQHKIEGSYDAIVIGSGMGGIATAAFMAKEGKKVLVLERHYTPGGFTHVFTRKKYEWDVGVHYVGDVHREHTELHKMFKYITDGRMKWEEMGSPYDIMFFGNDRYDFPAGTDEFKAQMKAYFPGEEKAIDEYVELIYATQKKQRWFFAEKILPNFWSWLLGNRLRKAGLTGNKTTLEVLQSLTKNKKLIGVLSGQYGDYGLPPAQSSFLMHAALIKHYMKGACYPVGGAQEIYNTVAPTIINAGGDVFTNAEVKEVIVKNRKAVGVKMFDGKEFFAPVVISDAGIYNTYQKLLPQNEKAELQTEKYFENLAPSVGHVCLYIGINESNKDLKLGKANYWIFPDNYDHDKNVQDYVNDPDAELPVVYISFPSSKDPDWDRRYPDRTTIEIVTLSPYSWYEKWKNKRWMKRGEDYNAFKEKLSQRLLEELYKKHPNLRGKIDYYELSTPLSTAHFANYGYGEIYGIDHTTQRFEQKFLKPRTPVKNLYLTGQDIVSCGVGGALFSGLITASAVTGKNLLNRLK
jgi:all-trans-retinol 13,14-reductase